MKERDMVRRGVSHLMATVLLAGLSGSAVAELGWGFSERLWPGDRPGNYQAPFGDGFGSTVALRGDVAFVAREVDSTHLLRAGSVYVYRRLGGRWFEAQLLVPSVTQSLDEFGAAISLADQVAVVGAPVYGNALPYRPGAAHVYRLQGDTWREEQRLVPFGSAPRDLFGTSVVAGEDFVFVGAPGHTTGAGPGAVHVFARGVLGWVEVQTLRPVDGGPGDQFGWSIARSGASLLIGATDHDDPEVNSGAAYLYQFDGARWVQTQKLRSPGGVRSHARFGQTVALSDSLALVSDGTLGVQAYRVGVNGRLEHDQLLDGGASGGGFGRAMALSGDRALIDAPLRSQIGLTYLYRRDADQWTLEHLFSGFGGISVSNVGGASVALADGAALFGVPKWPAGDAYVYENPPCRVEVVQWLVTDFLAFGVRIGATDAVTWHTTAVLTDPSYATPLREFELWSLPLPPVEPTTDYLPVLLPVPTTVPLPLVVVSWMETTGGKVCAFDWVETLVSP